MHMIVYSLRLLLGTEAPVMTPDGVDSYVLFGFHKSVHSQQRVLVQ